MKEKRKGKHKMWIAVLVILGVLALGFGGAIVFTEPGRRELRDLAIAAVDFQNLHDGTYVGEYRGTKDKFRDANVQVTVSSGEVSDIKALDGAMYKQGKPVEFGNGLTIDNLFGRVLQAQSLQVDVISGATLTSKAQLKAVEDALEQAQAK